MRRKVSKQSILWSADASCKKMEYKVLLASFFFLWCQFWPQQIIQPGALFWQLGFLGHGLPLCRVLSTILLSDMCTKKQTSPRWRWPSLSQAGPPTGKWASKWTGMSKSCTWGPRRPAWASIKEDKAKSFFGSTSVHLSDLECIFGPLFTFFSSAIRKKSQKY